MYVNVNDLEAVNDNLVLKITKWPNAFNSSIIIQNDKDENSYDNGRELYLGEVKSSNHDTYTVGSYIVVNIFFGVHVPSEVKGEKIKIIPTVGVVLSSKEKLNVMSDITKMQPGKDRIFIKLDKKEAVTKGGIIIPEQVHSGDPTAQDVRTGKVVATNYKGIDIDETVVIEEHVGQEIYLDENNNLYKVCYGFDVVAKINK